VFVNLTLGTGKPLWRDFEIESFEFAKKAIRRGSVMGRLGIQDTVCRSFEASFLVFRLPFAGRAKKGFL
jgi:hypothetical protein